MKYKLVNFAKQCSCGRDQRLFDLDQSVLCTCGRTLKLTEPVKAKLKAIGVAKPQK